MAFFSKEKTSYDDYNLACIVTFPPHQNRGFGKLLIEFSYYLTRGAPSPGTPERPLSDLGLKGYLAFWVAVVLRVCRRLLANAEPVVDHKPAEEGRSLRTRRAADVTEEIVGVNGVGTLAGVPGGPPLMAEMVKRPLAQKGQYTLTTMLEDLARACHLRTDDVLLVLTELGFLSSRRRLPPALADEDGDELGEWHNVEVVITHDAVDEAWASWRVRDVGVLEEKYCLL